MIDNAFPPLRLRLPHEVDHISVLVPRLNTNKRAYIQCRRHLNPVFFGKLLFDSGQLHV